MKTKILSLISLSILSLVLLAGMTSAVVDVMNVSATTQNATHNSQVTFSTYAQATTFTGQFDNSTFVLPNLFGASTTWSGSSTFTLYPNSNSSTQNLVVTVPQYQSAGVYTGYINFTGTYNGTGSIVINALPISVTVASTKSISVSSSTMSESSNTTTITVTNDGNVALSNIQLTAENGDFDVDISGTNVNSTDAIASLAAGASESVTITRTSDLTTEVGPKTVTIRANASDGTTSTGTVSTEVSYCEDCENNGHLNVEIGDVNIKSGFGDDDNYWYPFDKVEVEVNIDNDGSWDIKKVGVDWALYTEDGDKIVDGSEDTFKLNSDDDKTITFTFNINKKLKDLEGEGSVTLYVKAKGEIDDSDSSYDGDDTCDWDSIDVDLITDDTFVVIDDMEINGLTFDDWELQDEIPCGTELQISADVWNIGDDSQDNVYVMITNSELGISKKVEIGDISSFDYEKLETTLEIPENAEAKYYSLQFTVYDEDDDVFETSEDEDAARFDVLIKVAGNCKTKGSASVTPKITSGGTAGNELVVTATITNDKSTKETYILNVKGYNAWAELNALESNSFTLAAGESVEVPLTFNVNKDVEGDQTFNLEIVSSSDSVVKTQPVTVTISPKKSLLGSIGGTSWYIWAIAALNVLLIGAIVLVAVKVARE